MLALRLPTIDAIDAELARRGEKPHRTVSPFLHDPVGFARHCVAWPAGESLTDYQCDALATLHTKKREAIRAPHAAGKTTIAALAVHHFALTRDTLGDWKAITTAGSWLQLRRYLWPEIHKWARRLKWDVIGRPPYNLGTELLTLEMHLVNGDAFAAASENSTLIEGAHAKHLLFIYDEAKAIPNRTFDASEGAFSSPESSETLALAISTPGPPTGRFYDIHARKVGYEDWAARHITRDEMIAAGRTTLAWTEQRKRQWGEPSPLYQNRVLGNFASSEETTVIPLAWLEAANDRWREWKESGAPSPAMTALGVDVGLGGAQTVYATRHGMLLREILREPGPGLIGLMGVSGKTIALVKGTTGTAVVDADGHGAGVYSRIAEQKARVLPFRGSAQTDVTDTSGQLEFVNLRAAAWWGFRERLNPESGADVMLPPDDELTGDLTAPTWRMNSAGKIVIESKEDIVARLGRSPDTGDAVVMAFAKEIIDVRAKGGTWGR